jgi:hypothetical protein
MALTGNDLKNIGFSEGKALGVALDLIKSHYNYYSFEEKLGLLKEILVIHRRL